MENCQKVVKKRSKSGLFFTGFDGAKSTSQHLKVPKVLKVPKPKVVKVAKNQPHIVVRLIVVVV
jgi:hypothetical protein